MEEDTFKIYCYTNQINGKRYIGQTHLTLERRAGGEGYRYNEHQAFGAAIRKYGWESFTSEILEDNLTLEQANEREQYWIQKLNTLSPNGYNLASGGHNYSWHKESRQKLSKSMKGKKPWTTGKHLSDETKRKISQSNLGKTISEETREKIRQANLGKPCNEETKKKISASLTGIQRSEETKRKISKGRKGISSGLNRPHQSKVVLQFSLDGQFIAEYPSTREASRQTGINQSNISACCRGIKKRSIVGGFIWRYKDTN